MKKFLLILSLVCLLPTAIKAQSDMPASFEISGYVTTGSNSPVEDAIVSFYRLNSAVALTTTTDVDGLYEFTVQEGCAGIITVYYPEYSFVPQTVSPVYADEAGINFAGAAFACPWEYTPTPQMHIIYGGFIPSEIDFWPTIAGISINLGDWIGVFDGDQCLGAKQFNGNIDDNFYITAFGNDDGSTIGHQLTYVIYSNITGAAAEYYVPAANVAYQPAGSIITDPDHPFPNSDNGLFAYNGTSVITTMEAEADVVTVSGTVTMGREDGDPVADVVLMSTNYSFTSTDVNGEYILSFISGTTDVTITPYKFNYTFEPESATYLTLTENKTLNFIAHTDLYTISGIITDELGLPMANTTVRIYKGSDLISNVYTDANGYYEYVVQDYPFNGRVLPKKEGYYFAPYSYKILDTNTEDVTADFTGILQHCPWEFEISSQMQNLFGFYTYPYDSDIHRFEPKLNGIDLNDGDWIGVFYFDGTDYRCAGAAQWFREEPMFSLFAYGRDAYVPGFNDGQQIYFAIYSNQFEATSIGEYDDVESYPEEESVFYGMPITYNEEFVFHANTVTELKSLSIQDDNLMLAIYGVVTDTNGNPLSGVLIYSDTHEVLATTDATGAYYVENFIVYGATEPKTIIPAFECYAFDPLSYTTELMPINNIEKNFVGTYIPVPWEIDPLHGNLGHVTIIPNDAEILVNGEPLNYGNYVGIFYNDFDGVPRCGGYISWIGINNTIVVYSDNVEYTPDVKDGFADGESFQWFVYSYQEDSTRRASVTYSIGEIIGMQVTIDGLFTSNGLSKVTDIHADDYIESNIVASTPEGTYCGTEGYLPLTFTMVPLYYTYDDITYNWVVVEGDITSYYTGNPLVVDEIAYNTRLTVSGYITKGDNIYASNDTLNYKFINPIDIALSVSPTPTCAGNEVTLTAEVSGGDELTYTYLWTADPECVITDANLPVATAIVNQTTTFTFTVTSSVCESQATATVVVYDAIDDAVITPVEQHLCSGETAGVLTVNGTTGGSGNYIYTWMYKEAADADWTEDVVTEDNFYQPASPNSTDNLVYYYKAIVGDVDCPNYYFETNIVTIEWYQLLTVDLTADPAIVCNGSDIDLLATAQGGHGAYTYTFYLGETVLYSGANNYYTYVVASGIYGQLDFSVSVSDEFGCDPAVDAIVVDVPGEITGLKVVNETGEDVSNQIVATCEDTYYLRAEIENEFTALNYAAYKWQVRGEGDNEWYSIYGATTAEYTAAAEGTVSYYRVVVYIPNCPTQRDTVAVTISWDNYEIEVSISDDQTICEGGDFEPLTSVVSETPATYQWYHNNFPIDGADAPYYQPVEGGVYNLIVTNACGESFISNVVTLTVKNAPVVYAGEDFIICRKLAQYPLAEATAENCDWVYWTILSGEGNISNPSDVNPIFYPSLSYDGEVVLAMVGYSEAPCELYSYDYITITCLGTPDLTGSIMGDEFVCDAAESTYVLETTEDSPYLEYDWKITPRDAGTLTFVDDIATVVWAEGYVGYAQVNASIRVCEGKVKNYSLNVLLNNTPELDEIQGPALVSMLMERTRYYVDVDFKVDSYNWTVSPASAGTLEVEENSMFITWAPSFEGEAVISVIASNGCGADEVELDVLRSGYFSPDGLDGTEIDMTVYPNPNDGTFKLAAVNTDGEYDVEVYNYVGQLVYKTTDSANVTEITIPSATSGIYFVRLRNNGNTVVQRVVIK